MLGFLHLLPDSPDLYERIPTPICLVKKFQARCFKCSKVETSICLDINEMI